VVNQAVEAMEIHKGGPQIIIEIKQRAQERNQEVSQ
jgi:hypothetical protein